MEVCYGLDYSYGRLLDKFGCRLGMEIFLIRELKGLGILAMEIIILYDNLNYTFLSTPCYCLFRTIVKYIMYLDRILLGALVDVNRFITSDWQLFWERLSCDKKILVFVPLIAFCFMLLFFLWSQIAEFLCGFDFCLTRCLDKYI